MKYQTLLNCFVLFLTLCGCLNQKHITRPHPEISFQGDFLLFQGKKFTGIVEMHLDGVNVVRKTPYRGGIIDGIEEEYYANGQIAARREYSNNQKSGVHEGWFRNGHRSFHSEYLNDRYHGETWEWHNSGPLATYAKFEKGQCLGKKMWREDGAIYMNYVFPGGRAFGLPGAKLCFQMRGSEKKQVSP